MRSTAIRERKHRRSHTSPTNTARPSMPLLRPLLLWNRSDPVRGSCLSSDASSSEPTTFGARSWTNAESHGRRGPLGAGERFVARLSEYPERGEMMAAGGEE